MPLHGDDGDTGIESAWAAAIVSEASVALKPPRLLIEFRALCCRCPHPCAVLAIDAGRWMKPTGRLRRHEMPLPKSRSGKFLSRI